MLQVIGILNQARQMELDAIHNYMQFHYVLDGGDIGELAKQMKLIAIDEMRHAEKFAERIRKLQGRPVVGFDYQEIPPELNISTYLANIKLELGTVEQYNEMATLCRSLGDHQSADLLDKINEEEKKHLQYFECIAEKLQEQGNLYFSRFVGSESSIGSDRGYVISDSAII